MTAVVRGGGDDHGSIRDAGGGQLFDGTKYGNVAAELRREPPGTLDIGIGQRREHAATGFFAQLMSVQRVDSSHAANAGNGKF